MFACPVELVNISLRRLISPYKRTWTFTRPEAIIPKILPITLFTDSPAPLLLFSQDQPLFLSKFPLFPIKICCTVLFLADRWQIVLQFTRFCKICWYKSTQPRHYWDVRGWRLRRLFCFELSWVHEHLCLTRTSPSMCTCAHGWLNVPRFPSDYSRNILYSLNFLLFLNHSGNNSLRPNIRHIKGFSWFI